MCFKQKVLFIILYFAVIFNSSAQPISVIEEFTIKPGLCIVEEGKPCKQSFIFSWRLRQVIEACLYRGENNQSLHCASKKKVEVTLFMDLNLSDQFFLRVNNNQAQQDILVRQLTRDVRQVRRHVWSVF